MSERFYLLKIQLLDIEPPIWRRFVVPAINQHLKRIFADNELTREATVKQYLTTAADGKNYTVKHYNLQAIIAVGFKIENERAVHFRKWARSLRPDGPGRIKSVRAYVPQVRKIPGRIEMRTGTA